MTDTDHNFIRIKDYVFYLEVSKETNNKPYISFWKETEDEVYVVSDNEIFEARSVLKALEGTHRG